MKIMGLTRQHKIAWKSGRKFILKFSPQADFNFVQPCIYRYPILTCAGVENIYNVKSLQQSPIKQDIAQIITLTNGKYRTRRHFITLVELPRWAFVVWYFRGCKKYSSFTWWCHQMETFSVILALCVGNSPVASEFPSQRPVTRSFDVFFDLRLNKWWVNNRDARDLRCHRGPLWCHCNEL